jgi:hypothetical protein
MRGAYLPDWLYGFVPPSWWPARPRDFFGYTLNVLPIAANATVTRSVVFSKRLHSLVFGARALVTSTDDATVLQPAAGTPPLKTIRLANAAGNEVYGSHPVPIENLCGCGGMGAAAGTRWEGQFGNPSYWPVPLAVPKGADLQVIMVNLHTAQAHNVRITFYVAVLDTALRKVA